MDDNFHTKHCDGRRGIASCNRHEEDRSDGSNGSNLLGRCDGIVPGQHLTGHSESHGYADSTTTSSSAAPAANDTDDQHLSASRSDAQYGSDFSGCRSGNSACGWSDCYLHAGQPEWDFDKEDNSRFHGNCIMELEA